MFGVVTVINMVEKWIIGWQSSIEKPFVIPSLTVRYLNQVSSTLCNIKLVVNLRTGQQTFQRCFIVVFRLIRRRDVEQCRVNVETTLCISILEFTTPNNVESTLCISTLIWTKSDNVETTLPFSTSST